MNDNHTTNDNDKYKNNGVIGNYGYKINDNFKFESGLRFANSYLDYDEVATERSEVNNSTDDTEISYNLKLIHKAGKFKNTIVYNKTDIERATKDYTNTSKNYFGERDAINLVGEYNFDLDTRIVYGLDNEIDKAYYQKDWPYSYTPTDSEIYSQYFDVQFRPLEKLYSTIGFRRDDHKIAGDETTGRTTVAYKLNNNSKIRSSIGTGIKFPALYDYYYGTTVKDKEILKAERSKSFDIGYETFIEKMNMNLNISAFKITYDEPLESQEGNVDNGNTWVVMNSPGKIKSKGIELSTNWRPKSNFNINLNYNYNETYDGADCDDPNLGVNKCIDPAMVRVPRHAVISSINYLNKNKLKNTLLIKYSGETRDYGNTNNDFADQILDDYITFDYMGSLKLYDTYDLFFTVNNIFDQNYEQAYQYSTLTRSFNFGLKKVY